jgi:hypothetical protein
MRRTPTFLICLLLAPALLRAEDHPPFAKVLEKHCIKCHHAGEKSGALALDSLAAIEAGGDSGPAIDKASAAQSLLIQYVTGDKPEMPKEGPPLSKEEIATLTDWIAAGAAWPAELKIEAPKAPTTDWWSLKPIEHPAPPKLSAEQQSLARTPIDAFLLDRLSKEGLTFAPEASRRVLIRRLYFDLLGLPPTPEEIAAFESDDKPLAYERLIEKLLASPRYGERWARHWLDLVHYGETHGYDKDKPRPNAWPYRDYVIRAFNSDKPYSQFVQEQLAGDILFPETRDGLEALGFLAAGPWDFIGHAEVAETKIDGKVARHLDRDDMVSTTIQAFNSLTIGCAQCHNHKFDPILQEDYYSLHAVFAAIDRTDRNYDVDPRTAEDRKNLTAAMTSSIEYRDKLRKEIEHRVALYSPDLIAKREFFTKAKPSGDKPPEFGYHSELAAAADTVKWVEIELAAPAKVKEIILHACHDDFNGIGEGFGFPKRFYVEVAGTGDFSDPAWIFERVNNDYPNPGLVPVSIPYDGEVKKVRLTATRLAQRLPTDYMLALAEIEVIDKAGKNVAQGAKVTSLDSIEAPDRWRRTNLTDGKYPQPAATREAIEAVNAEYAAAFDKQTNINEKESLAEVESRIRTCEIVLKKLPPQKTAYIGAIHTGTGTFTGTGASGGRPRPIHILKRGNVTQPAEEMGPGAIKAIAELDARFDDIREQPESARRAALAQWLTDAKHPLTWRSIVNRVWQHHFGTGIVASANDFGRKGELPSHPELLDYLASEFRDGRQSIKDLHRQILLSTAYRQSSSAAFEGEAFARRSVAPSTDASPQAKQLSARLAEEVDPSNRLLWKMPRRRIEAEALRDSALILAGEMRYSMYGPSFKDFIIDKPEHSPHYLYDKHDPHDPAAYRRSIYRFLVRSQPQPLMAALDCADPSINVDKRNESVSATQALSLLNDPFMTLMAEKVAARLSKEHDSLETQLEAGFEEATGRKPTDQEQTLLKTLTEKHGLQNTCRMLLNLNEFVFID